MRIKRDTKSVIKPGSKYVYSHICTKCGSDFETVQSYTEHRRFCNPFSICKSKSIPKFLRVRQVDGVGNLM